MDAIGRQISVKMTSGLLGWEKWDIFRIPGSGYYFLIPWGEMRWMVSRMAGVSVVRDHTP